MNRKIKILFAAVVSVIIIGLMPTPIFGYFDNPIGCLCENEKYLKVDDGKVILMYCGHETGDWVGSCKQNGIGDNVFRFWPNYKPIPVYSTLLFIAFDGIILFRKIPNREIKYTERHAVITRIVEDNEQSVIVKYDANFNEISRKRLPLAGN